MALVTLELAREHCKADGDDDTMLSAYLAAAESACVRVLNRNVYAGAVPAEDGTGILVTPDIVAAILVAVAVFYRYRQGEGPSDLPAASLALLRAYRWMPAP